jgi:serine/threonine protein phosphatase 1
MGDIHGAYKALRQCLERSSFNYDNDWLIQLGDIVDGYPEVYECVEELLKLKKLVPIKGNHDDWFHSFIETDFHPSSWTYGGKGTLLSYLSHAGKNGKFFAVGSGYNTSLVSNDVPQTHKDFFNSQQLYHIDEQDRCFVHGGFNRHLPFSKQKKENFFWDRSLWAESLQTHTYNKNIQLPDDFFDAVDFREIYIGHTPTTKWGTDKPLRALNILNLDTGAGHSGRLTIMDIDTKKYWQSDPLLELYTENFR